MTATDEITNKWNTATITIHRSEQPGGLVHYSVNGTGVSESDLKVLFREKLEAIEQKETVLHWRVEPDTVITNIDAAGQTYYELEARFTTAPKDMEIFHRSADR